MKMTAAKLLAINAVSITCVIVSAIMAIKGVHGWGWFLVVAVLAGHSISTADSEDEKDD